MSHELAIEMLFFHLSSEFNSFVLPASCIESKWFPPTSI